jgi:hypothetical protein
MSGWNKRWAATKAAYRFFSNSRVHEGMILAGHFAATKARMAAAKGTILVVRLIQLSAQETLGDWKDPSNP